MGNRYNNYRAKKDPIRDIFWKIVDPNIGTPDIFFVMDEVSGTQILRRFDKSSGVIEYTGTYEILYKTMDRQGFYLIMTRVSNEWSVHPEFRSVPAEYGAWIVASYYPGVCSRIYLKGLPEASVSRIVKEYQTHQDEAAHHVGRMRNILKRFTVRLLKLIRA